MIKKKRCKKKMMMMMIPVVSLLTVEHHYSVQSPRDLSKHVPSSSSLLHHLSLLHFRSLSFVCSLVPLSDEPIARKVE